MVAFDRWARRQRVHRKAIAVNVTQAANNCRNNLVSHIYWRQMNRSIGADCWPSYLAPRTRSNLARGGRAMKVFCWATTIQGWPYCVAWPVASVWRNSNCSMPSSTATAAVHRCCSRNDGLRMHRSRIDPFWMRCGVDWPHDRTARSWNGVLWWRSQHQKPVRTLCCAATDRHSQNCNCSAIPKNWKLYRSLWPMWLVLLWPWCGAEVSRVVRWPLQPQWRQPGQPQPLPFYCSGGVAYICNRDDHFCVSRVIRGHVYWMGPSLFRSISCVLCPTREQRKFYVIKFRQTKRNEWKF